MEDEFSFKEAYYFIHRIWRYVLSKWYILLTICLVGTSAAYLIALNKKPIYIGTITFVLSTESKTSALGGIASQFGIDLGGGGSNDLFSGDNIISLFRSHKMIRKVLFKKPPQNDSLLINILVTHLRLNLKWNKLEHLKSSFPFNADTLCSPVQDSLINSICKLINEDILTVSRTDKKLSIYEVNAKSSNEIISCYLSRFLVDETTNFYINTKTSLAKLNLLMLQKEADSLKSLLGYSITSAASEVDRTFNLNPALQIQKSGIQKKQVNTTVLGTAYGEIVKNLELAKINLQRETPLFQIIDIPSIPLEAVKASKLIYSLIGLFVSFIVSLIILWVLRLKTML